MSRNGYAVEIENLVKHFGKFRAVDHVSMAVNKGEIFGFLGPNGAGKSTTIRMLCGLLMPSQGRASVNGFDVSTQPEMIKKSIGYMSQKFSLYDDLTVAENIEFFSGIYGVAESLLKDRKEYVLEMAGLLERRNSLTRELSGGWKQRLALGCAILHQPPILFLDEPTSGVDPIARRSFWDLIYQLAAQKNTIFVSTHYMDEAEYCHRVALMFRGKVIAMGTPAALKNELASYTLLHLETSDLVGSIMTLEGQEVILDVAVFGNGLHIRLKPEAKAGALIRQVLEHQGIQVLKLEPIPPSMEDVFVAMIEEEERKLA
jgi:drug efflux transport system ATP-binding protein